MKNRSGYDIGDVGDNCRVGADDCVGGNDSVVVDDCGVGCGGDDKDYDEENSASDTK